MTAVVITASLDRGWVKPLATLRSRGVACVVVSLDVPAFERRPARAGSAARPVPRRRRRRGRGDDRRPAVARPPPRPRRVRHPGLPRRRRRRRSRRGARRRDRGRRHRPGATAAAGPARDPAAARRGLADARPAAAVMVVVVRHLAPGRRLDAGTPGGRPGFLPWLASLGVRVRRHRGEGRLGPLADAPRRRAVRRARCCR